MFRWLSRDRESEQITTADIITLASMARLGRVIGLDQENIIINAIRLNHTTVDRVMIPSDKVDFLHHHDNIDTILDQAMKTSRTRYPITSTDKNSDIDHFINIKGLLPMIKGDLSKPELLQRPLLNVFANDTLLSALRTMLANRQHMLAVIGKNRKSVGIITLEDITAELLGADIEEFK
jgi:CBS domain containing-hemolysin-like protein